MIIDFHTHIFPDKIAGKTIAHLAKVSGFTPAFDGTYNGLLGSIEDGKIDLSIALPVVTKPSQFDSINRFAASHMEGKVLSFGGIHPDTEDYKKDLKQLKEMGFKGVKLHPDYQGVYFNDIRYKRIVSYATELEMIISVHAGVDPLCPDDVHTTPSMSLEVIKECEPQKLVLAHMGGTALYDEVEDKLIGENVFFDTAVVLDKIDEEQFVRMVRNHGADKILFGTDCPWGGQKEYVHILNAMPLSEREKQLILEINARKLLNI